MQKKEKYLKDLESTLKKYKIKISEIDGLLKKKKIHNKDHLVKGVKEKYKQAEGIFQKLKSSSQDNFEEIKESSVEIFESLKEAFNEFIHLITMDDLSHAKDDITAYGSEKVCEVGDYIKKKPYICAAWVFGVGFLIGTFLKRSK